ncbi:ADP-ribosylglycohydrolase family protein [Methanobrevibacter sp.]|uniref:ADP-ribosylglycohydrolase family protein n=1 Tax=Methanobrevibacter sp. TaxID=66852 RepID=UPI00386C539D
MKNIYNVMKVKDGIIGFVVGDALGVPVEFHDREDLEKNPVVGMKSYGTYNMPAGTWSDDSAMTIATMTSIVNMQEIDYEDIMNEFVKWAETSEHMQEVTGDIPFDMGITTSHAIFNYRNGAPALESGCCGERDNGNGSLMRILPLAYIKDIDWETVENISALTHAHERSKISCALYVAIAKSMLENDLSIREHIGIACDKIKKHYEKSPELKNFQRIFDNDLDDINGKGYVIYTLECVIHCLLTTDSYRDAVLKAVNIGADTDTNAAICGGLAGIYYGYDSIPVDWINEIDRIDDVVSLCEKYEEYCDRS